MKMITYTYFVGCKDATLVMDNVDGKCCHQAELEEHDVVVGEPGDFHTMENAPQDGKGHDRCKLRVHQDLRQVTLRAIAVEHLPASL